MKKGSIRRALEWWIIHVPLVVRAIIYLAFGYGIAQLVIWLTNE